MDEPLLFADRAAFRIWLMEHHPEKEGVWLLFGKPGGPKTLKASEALEEALCFGWIDGVMRSVDKGAYLKYFSPRRPGSRWSPKNKALAQDLIQRGLMTASGRDKIEQAKANGQWDAPKPADVTPEHIALLEGLLKPFALAHTNFMAMPPSVKKTYARAYFDAKTDDGRQRRLSWMVDRLNQNLKPM